VADTSSLQSPLTSPLAAQAIPRTGASGNDAKIDRSSKDFESMLLSSWLQQAYESFGSVGGEDEDGDLDSGKQQFQGIAMQSLGTAMTASGGIGIAKMITSYLHKKDEDGAKAVQMQQTGGHR
jgi:Rod binding domain-containing protein